MPVSLLLLQSDVWSLIAWRTMPAFGITLAFALIAYGLRAVTASGALAGLIVTYCIFLAAGPAGFLAVMTVFVLTVGATRFAYTRNSPRGTETPQSSTQALEQEAAPKTAVENAGADAPIVEPAAGLARDEVAEGTESSPAQLERLEAPTIQAEPVRPEDAGIKAEDIASDAHGRDALQIYANLLPAALVAIPAIFHPRAAEALFIAMSAALAEAAADTVSSEIGQGLNAPTYLITNWRSTPNGDNGGVSVAGTAAGIIAAFIVSFACAWMRLVDFQGFVIAALAGIAGMFCDSYLGATLERPERLGNNSVNFTSTVFAACLALVTVLLLR